MDGYLDASVVVPLFIDDLFANRATAILDQTKPIILVSDWLKLECSNVIVRKAREAHISQVEAQNALTEMDQWFAEECTQVFATAADIVVATELVRRLDLKVRGPDAVHVAIAQRLRATLFTFDNRMAEAAAALGLPVES